MMSLKEKFISGLAAHPRLVTIGTRFAIAVMATAVLTFGVMDLPMAAAVKDWLHGGQVD